jgi:hypothetical protein
VLHTRDGIDGRLYRSKVRLELVGTAVSAAWRKPRHWQAHRQHTVRHETRLYVDQLDETSDQESRPAQKNECDRDFADDQGIEHPASCPARRRASSAHGTGKAWTGFVVGKRRLPKRAKVFGD